MASADFRVDRQSLAALDEDGYFWALVEPAWPSVEVADDERGHLLTATPGQRILYSTILLSRDVSNGGLWQAFWNFEPWFMALAENSFATIGAKPQSKALLAARDLLDRWSMQGPLGRRRAYLDAHKLRLQAAFDRLDPKFYDEERFYPLYHRYVDAHPDEFFRS